jgi:tetratricopeptide (TPR) repeat protein
VPNVEADMEGVNQALARLLAWPEIARSPQLANFLTYIVERRLSGDAQSIKAYSIAVDVFGRTPDFDPQADPIVRVQARRLRGLLDQYYRGPGLDEPLRIQLPIGRYIPDFIDSATEPSARPIGREPSVPLEPVPAARPRGHVTLSWFVLLVLAIGATAITYSLATWGPRRDQVVVNSGAMQMPRLRVMEFQNLTGDNSLTPPIAALAVELVADFEPLIVVDPVFGGRGGAESSEQSRDDFVLTGIVRPDVAAPGTLQFNAILTDVPTNSVVWNWTGEIETERLTARDGIGYISQELIIRLGGTRGPLHRRAREFLAAGDIAGQENFYLCGLLFINYRTAPSVGSAARFEACVGALGEGDQENPNMLAGRASVLAESGPMDGDLYLARIEEAESMLTKALQAAPTSSFVWEQRARLHEMMGLHEEAEAAYGTALQLSAANIDGTAARARHLALMGQLERAIPLAQRAIDAVPPLDIPDWYYCVPAMVALRDNTFQRAQRLAEDCGHVDLELGPILSMLIAQSAGDAGRVGQVLPLVLEVPSFRSGGIMTRLRIRIMDQALLGQIEVTLLKAGVPERSLDGPY